MCHRMSYLRKYSTAKACFADGNADYHWPSSYSEELSKHVDHLET